MEQDKKSRFVRLPLIWALVFGLIGAVCGCLGSIVLNPNSGQAPILWILLGGPRFFALGGVIGLVFAIIGLRERTHFYAIRGASIIVGVAVLYLSAPEDRYLGFVVDGEMRSCIGPEHFVAERVKWWQESIDKTKWREPRIGWRDDLERMLSEDHGAVLEIFVYREMKLYESRKPWSNGVKKATSWKNQQKIRQFYTRFNGSSCVNYNAGERSLYFPEWEVSRVSPPDILPTFLGMYVLTDVPDEFQRFVGR